MAGLKGKHRLTLEQKNGLIGYGFILLWLIGFVAFFLLPVLESLIYSFSEVKVTTKGMKTIGIGLENYKTALLVDPDYFRNLAGSIKSMFLEVPIISMFSMIIACILNQDFRGRTLARVIFFLPVIVASGVAIQVLTMGGMSTDVNGKDTIFMLRGTPLKAILMEAGINQSIVDYFTNLMSNIFNITWKSGIQIILFLAGLQTIPSSYYEVSSLEGATAWESFWKITFPLLSPMTLVCVVYTIIDSFTYYQNPVMQTIKLAFDGLKYGLSAAESWMYFIIIFVIIILVTKIVFSNVVYTEE